MRANEKLREYFHTHSDSMIWYYTIQMQLNIHRDTLYLSVSKATSIVGRQFFLSDIFDPISPTEHNVVVLVVTAILKMSWRPPQKQNWEAYSSTPTKVR